MMKIYSQDKSELMEIQSLGRDGNNLVIKGKVFGTMPMSARLKPGDARKGLRLLNVKLVFFLITFLLRKEEEGSTKESGDRSQKPE